MRTCTLPLLLEFWPLQCWILPQQIGYILEQRGPDNSSLSIAGIMKLSLLLTALLSSFALAAPTSTNEDDAMSPNEANVLVKRYSCCSGGLAVNCGNCSTNGDGLVCCGNCCKRYKRKPIPPTCSTIERATHHSNRASRRRMQSWKVQDGAKPDLLESPNECKNLIHLESTFPTPEVDYSCETAS